MMTRAMLRRAFEKMTSFVDQHYSPPSVEEETSSEEDASSEEETPPFAEEEIRVSPTTSM